MFEIIFLVFLSIYFIQTIVFLIGTKKKFPQLNESDLPTISVIVAARNEEENIVRCMKSLEGLIYPENKIEIILVDDRSTDKTGSLISDFIKGKDKFKKVVTEERQGKLIGKTNALASAIKSAKGEIILTTDADCAVNPLWAKTIASYYLPDVGLANGFTSQEYFNNFSGMQNLDFIYLLTVAAGTINYNMPLSCIGNNMSYRKSAYNEVGGYESLPFSVTEDFNLLFAIHKLKKYKVIYPFDSEGHVISKPCQSWKELLRQKKRWGVGGMKSPLRGYFVMASGFITHIAIILSPFFFSPVTAGLITFKLIIDFMFLYVILKDLKIADSLKYFLAFEIYFIFYVVLLPVIVLPSQKVKWKDRTF